MTISIHAAFRALALTDGKVSVKHARASQVKRAHTKFRPSDAGGSSNNNNELAAGGSSAIRRRPNR